MSTPRCTTRRSHSRANSPSAGRIIFISRRNAAWAERGEDGTMFISSSTQHPSEVQHIVAHVLGLPMHSVVVECPRMGGGFGGKETQAATLAALAALAATKTGRKVRVRFNRDQDMMITGKRHPFLGEVSRRLRSRTDCCTRRRSTLFSNGGWSLDLSRAVTDRAVFHLDNAYYIPHVEFSGRVAKTNLASNTAFRGFGGPQGMLVIEEIIDRIARRDRPRHRKSFGNEIFIAARGETNTTHYGQEIEDNRIQRIWHELTGLERIRVAPRGVTRMERSASESQARPRHHAGEIRHFIYDHASQSGRRARAALPGWHRAGESRRHRDGPGRSHQHRDDRGARTGPDDRSRARDGDAHGQGAEHFRHRRFMRHGFEWRRREECV